MAGLDMFPVDSGHRCFYCERIIDCGELFLKVEKAYTVSENGLRRDIVQLHAGDQLCVVLCLNCAAEHLYDLVKDGDQPY